VRVDDRSQLSPGWKFNEWELKGVPIRLEIGPRDLAAGAVTLVSRLGGDKEQVLLGAVVAELPRRLVEFQQALRARAEEFRAAHTESVATYSDLVRAVGTGFALALHCGSEACEARLKEETSATPRCIPRDGVPEEGPCAICGEPATYGTRVLFARAY
jgi:prolyl-tRNA synthetase